ncbi:hypothetical protein BDN72DRAFT_901257 [Pluteus cervinus]|uniref:Uncharacterized protein n=1 Tax=Pluteus cervinus TaxID=181527 RepID=A0ACD3AGL9_9AGAR|nr:hypothetical protein BDN72DRAFT_901257 [Pluteus cervinus]
MSTLLCLPMELLTVIVDACLCLGVERQRLALVCDMFRQLVRRSAYPYTTQVIENVTVPFIEGADKWFKRALSLPLALTIRRLPIESDSMASKVALQKFISDYGGQIQALSIGSGSPIPVLNFLSAASETFTSLEDLCFQIMPNQLLADHILFPLGQFPSLRILRVVLQWQLCTLDIQSGVEKLQHLDLMGRCLTRDIVNDILPLCLALRSAKIFLSLWDERSMPAERTRYRLGHLVELEITADVACHDIHINGTFPALRRLFLRESIDDPTTRAYTRTTPLFLESLPSLVTVQLEVGKRCSTRLGTLLSHFPDIRHLYVRVGRGQWNEEQAVLSALKRRTVCPRLERLAVFGLPRGVVNESVEDTVVSEVLLSVLKQHPRLSSVWVRGKVVSVDLPTRPWVNNYMQSTQSRWNAGTSAAEWVLRMWPDANDEWGLDVWGFASRTARVHDGFVKYWDVASS